jgi:glycosyltransferase involved in cell wall biosynthesis
MNHPGIHVLLVHQIFVSPAEAGGTRHYELAKHFVGRGHCFTIVGSQLSYLTGKLVVDRPGLVTRENLNGVKVLRAYTYPALHRSFIWRVISFLSFMVTSVFAGLKVESIDLVMGTSPPIFQAVSAWLLSIIHHKPFLLEIRDLWPDFAIEMKILTNPVLIKLSRLLEHFLYSRAKHILVNSPAYRDYLIAKGITSEKISVIPNGVEVARFKPEARGGSFRRRWELDGKFVLTYAGALGQANDIPTVIRAADRLRNYPQIHFLMVGDGKEKASLEKLAKRLNLPNVTFTGARPKAEMPDILAASDACIATLQNIPMFKTTYPNKVFDYMAAGRPTILGIDGVIRAVMESANGGIFVPPGDDKALADAALRLESDRDSARSMGAAARSYVVERFDRYKQADQFVELIMHLCRELQK